jgi:hypothetical protein
VIATGLGAEEQKEERKRRLQVVPEGSEENMDIPTFLRRGKSIDQFSDFRFHKATEPFPEVEERYDVPTFMRKQPD